MIWIVLLGLATSPVLRAGVDTLSLNGNFSSPDYSFYSYTDIYGTSHSGIPVGPYITYLTGPGYNNTLIYTFCYDFNSPTQVGTAYPGTLETPTDTATLESTYLINELNNLGLFNAPATFRDEISMAIWEIMNPSSTTSGFPFPSDPAAQVYEAQAAAAVAQGLWTAADSARYPTWVPDDSSIQRFGTILPSSVPEPRSWVLMSSIIIGLGALGWRRRSLAQTRLGSDSRP